MSDQQEGLLRANIRCICGTVKTALRINEQVVCSCGRLLYFENYKRGKIRAMVLDDDQTKPRFNRPLIVKSWWEQ